MLHKHVAVTLSYVHKPQLETGCILAVLAATTWHAAKTSHIRLRQMGSLSPPFLGQDVMEIASLLQYPLAHGQPTNSASQGEGSGSHGNIVWKEPRHKYNTESQPM